MAGEPETAWPPHLPRGPAPLIGKLAQTGAQLRLRRPPGLVANAFAISFNDTAHPPLGHPMMIREMSNRSAPDSGRYQ
jgi:hypothetical protein